MRLEGKIALITAAATGVKGELMGFGGASARLFALEGAKLVLTDINEAMGEKTAAQIRDDGGEAIFFRLDVTSEEDWANAIQTTIETYGGLDILVNNAGMRGSDTLAQTSVEDWDRMMDVHAKGAFLGTKYGAAEMKKGGGGSIINVSSMAGLVGSSGATSYHAAKGAIRLLTKAVAVQLADDGIRVNSVHPGYAVTPMTRQLFQDPSAARWRLERVPMGRFATADEIAYGILYLASDESSYVTGAELVIDGGYTAQ